MTTFADASDAYLDNAAEPRTSALAVTSFVCSMICCIPILSIFLGLLGAGLGVGSLVLIGRSNGRLRGRGFAFAGVGLGLFTAVLWVGILVGGVRALGGYVNAGTAVFEAIDAGDMAQARAAFLPALDQSASDEQITAFAQMIRDDYGGFVSGPSSLLEYWSGMASSGRSGNAPGFSFGDMPIAIEYETDAMLAFMRMPDGSSKPAPGRFIRDLGYQRPDGTTVWLSEIEAGGDDPPAGDDTDR